MAATMTASGGSTASRRAGAARLPRLEVPWGGGWRQWWETLRELRTPLPLLPPQAALTAFSTAQVAQGWPGRAFLVSVALHVLFLVVPLPEFLTRPPASSSALSQIRIEYDLRWTGGSRALPAISPARRSRSARPARPGGRKNQPLPRRGADAVQAQTIVSNPSQPNHPRQTLLTQFGLEKARLQARELRLPNVVIPASPAALPMLKVDLRRLRFPQTAPPLQAAPPAPETPRLKRSRDFALAKTRLENLFPKLTVAASSGGTPRLVSSQETGAGTAAPSNGYLTPPGVLVLSAQPAPPTAVLELSETNLRARFATGPYPGPGSPGGVAGGTLGAAGGSGEGPGGEGGGAGGLAAPEIFVASAGPVPPGPVIVGPGSGGGLPGEVPPPAQAAREGAAAAKPEGQPRKSPGERAEEILEGLGPGARPGATGGRRIYTIFINMPNLTSQTGSWVLRFAELGEESGSAAGGAANGFALEAPVAVRKVDPRYPTVARQQRVEGTVFLYGVIREDGAVDSVRIVHSVHELLDQNAVAAFERWRFQPGRKNGAPVSLEVVVEIPFRLSKLF